MTKKKLIEKNEHAKNEIDSLKDRIHTLEKQRTALVNEMSDSSAMNKAEKNVYIALADNIVKSVKSKQIINMKPEEVANICAVLDKFENGAKRLDHKMETTRKLDKGVTYFPGYGYGSLGLI